MDPSTNLNPEAIRKIGLRLYGAERFQTDPASAILDTIAWVDEVLGDANSATPMQDDLIRRLGEIINQKGAANVASELKVSVAAVRSWLNGVRPTDQNRKRIGQFLSDTLPPEEVGTAKPGELVFGQLQPPEPGE